MKIVWKILVVLIIVVPIVMCWKTLQQVWEDTEDFGGSGDNNTQISAEDLARMQEQIKNEENKMTVESELGDGVPYVVNGITPTSKVYENAEIAISLANIYKEHDETSEVLGKLEKGAHITVQNYDNGWSRVTNYTTSGWMKTANIKFPEVEGNMELVTPSNSETKTGTVKVSDSLNVRAEASKTAAKIGSLTNGQKVTILDDSETGWYKIKVDALTGWVSADYVTINN